MWGSSIRVQKMIMLPTHHSQLLVRAKLIFAPHLPFQPTIFPAVPLMLFPFVSIFCASFLFSLHIFLAFWRSLFSFFPQSDSDPYYPMWGESYLLIFFVKYVSCWRFFHSGEEGMKRKFSFGLFCENFHKNLFFAFSKNFFTKIDEMTNNFATVFE
jgi:hypothetical protein